MLFRSPRHPGRLQPSPPPERRAQRGMEQRQAAAVREWMCGRFRLALGRPLIMGIVNVTPDSFSDRRDRTDPVEAIEWARRLIDEGADLLDIGGESTRPGAPPVAASLELDRVLPVLSAMRDCGVPVSIDTRKPEVMREAVAIAARHRDSSGRDVILEASGGLTLDVARAVAETGVDYISVGGLTHSVTVLDIGLDLEDVSTN